MSTSANTAISAADFQSGQTPEQLAAKPSAAPQRSGDVIPITDANTAIASTPAALPAPPIIAAPYQWLEPSQLPPRPWIYGHQLLRGSVSMIIAPGGSGKTALATGMALSMATGLEFMGSKVWGGPKKVWIWNLEDSIEELSRGIQAAATYWQITEADLLGNLFLCSALSGDQLKLVSNRSGGLKEEHDLAKAIVAEMKVKAIDVLFIDPFVSSHDANENDNKSMDAVVKLLALIAYEANCSIVLLHHTNKGFGQVNENSSRGASSVVNAARSVMTINTMTKEVGESFGIDEDEVANYIKLHDHKNNRISACRSSTYMKFESVMMATSDGTEESVGVLVPVDLTAHGIPDLNERQIAEIQIEIDNGFDRQYHTADKWIGHIVGRILNLDTSSKLHKKWINDKLSQLVSDGYIKIIETKKKNGVDAKSYAVVKRAKPFPTTNNDKPPTN